VTRSNHANLRPGGRSALSAGRTDHDLVDRVRRIKEASWLARDVRLAQPGEPLTLYQRVAVAARAGL
jgi:hypothetical protein